MREKFDGFVRPTLMRIWSVAKTEKGHQLVEIEIVIVPGLPRVIVTGLPDQTIKESALRLKPTFRALGLPWPKTKTVMMNLKPQDLPKSGASLDLAMAMGLLVKMGHLKLAGDHLIAVGSINFDGTIDPLEDLPSIDLPEMLNGVPVWMNSKEPSSEFDIIRTRRLDQLETGCEKLQRLKLRSETPHPKSEEQWSRFRWSRDLGRAARVAAIGRHSALLLGSAGAGKSTLARLIHRCLPPPDESVTKQIRLIHQRFRMKAPIRPFVFPHHISTPKTLIGGYHRLGEIHRAHGGVLCMDELFKFSLECQDALREPTEVNSLLRIGSSRHEMLPCDFLLIGTSNLCRCGKLGIGRSREDCGCSRQALRVSLNQFSGPLLDRFDMILHIDQLQALGDRLSLEDLLQTPPPLAAAGLQIPDFYSRLMDLQRLSRRRTDAFERVCQTLSRLQTEPLQGPDFEWAFEMTVNSYNRLQQLRNEV